MAVASAMSGPLLSVWSYVAAVAGFALPDDTTP